MEEKVFRRGAVASELKNFVEARLHTDSSDNALRDTSKQLEQRLAGSAANPVYVILNPRTGVKLRKFVGATLADDTPFLRFLERARSDRNRSGTNVLKAHLVQTR